MINTVALTGRLTSDPEVKITSGNKKVCNFTLAVNDGYGEKKTVYFFLCVVWQRQAEVLAQYSKQGDLIGVEGKLTQKSYVGKDDNRVIINEILCAKIVFLNTRTNTYHQEEQEQQEEQEPSYKEALVTSSPEQNHHNYTNAAQETEMPDEDDLPF